MITTYIALGEEENYPTWHKSTGLAKSLSIARWMFEFCGWKSPGKQFPDIGYVEEVVEWPEGDKYFPSIETELWVLGSCLQMN